MTQKHVGEDQLVPSKFQLILKESKWLIFGAFALFLFVILLTYNKADPGWSHQATSAVVHNSGGQIGAWLSDFLFYTFGIGAYAFPFACVCMLFPAFRYDKQSDEKWWRYAGGILMLVALTAFASLKLNSFFSNYPLGAGGILGISIAKPLQALLGSIGAALLTLFASAIGFSLMTKISWIHLAERIGYGVEMLFDKVFLAYQAYQDRKVGKIAVHERDVILQQEAQEPFYESKVQIVEPTMDIPQKRSREPEVKQQALFQELARGELPPLSLLHPPKKQEISITPETLEFTSRLIERKLADYGVKVKVTAAFPGPVITRYEIEPEAGVKGAQIVSLMRDLARALCVVSIRIIETIPEKSCMGLEVPNPRRQMVVLSEILGSEAFNGKHAPLTVALGKDISGNPVVTDLAKMPHLLVAGTTGSGKSVGINAMILSLIYKSTPEQVRMILIDPKMLELSIYEGIPHLLAPVVTDMTQAGNALNWCVAEMERRYKLMSSIGVRNLAGFNTRVNEAAKSGQPLRNKFSLTPENPEPLSPLPYIVIIIDELADLMMVSGKKVEGLIARLAQKARAAGVHLVLATQRPSVDVITGLIKSNIPSRMAFQLPTKIDSKTILDQMGAESLLGQGDMLFMPPGTGYPSRVHGAFVDDDEVRTVTDFLRQTGEPNYIDGILSSVEEGGDSNGGGGGSQDMETDPLYDEAVALVLKTRRASISMVQRQLRIGYNRSARLIEQMEKSGIVSVMQPNGSREVLAPSRSEVRDMDA